MRPPDPKPKIVIRIRDGLTIFTEVLFDGKNLPVTRVMFDSGDSLTNSDHKGLVFVSLTMLADLDVEVDGAELDVRDVRATDIDPVKVEADLSTVGEYGYIKPKVRPDRFTIQRILYRWVDAQHRAGTVPPASEQRAVVATKGATK